MTDKGNYMLLMMVNRGKNTRNDGIIPSGVSNLLYGILIYGQTKFRECGVPSLRTTKEIQLLFSLRQIDIQKWKEPTCDPFRSPSPSVIVVVALNPTRATRSIPAIKDREQ